MATACGLITPVERIQMMLETDDFSPQSSAGSVDSGFTENEEGSNSVQDIHKKWGNCPPDSSSLPPCRVCEEKASGWHYGANTCEPCKVCSQEGNTFQILSPLTFNFLTFFDSTVSDESFCRRNACLA